MSFPFSESTHRLAYVLAGGQCQCLGCGTPSLSGVWGHASRCTRTFRFALDRTTTEDPSGYNLDHINNPWEDSITNCRVICVECHKRTITYGRGHDYVAILGALMAPKPNSYEKLLQILAQPEPASGSSLAYVLGTLTSQTPPVPVDPGSFARTILGMKPKPQ